MSAPEMGKRRKPKISVTYLRKKYPRPVRSMGSCDGEYCVAGALCCEVGMAIYFPRWEQLRDAIELATQINHYTVSDEDNELFRGQCVKIIEMNDIGNFEGAWRELRNLLLWKPKDRFVEASQ